MKMSYSQCHQALIHDSPLYFIISFTSQPLKSIINRSLVCPMTQSFHSKPNSSPISSSSTTVPPFKPEFNFDLYQNIFTQLQKLSKSIPTSTSIPDSTSKAWFRELESILNLNGLDTIFLTQILHLLSKYYRKSSLNESTLKLYLRNSSFKSKWKRQFMQTITAHGWPPRIRRHVVLSSVLHSFGTIRILPGSDFLTFWYTQSSINQQQLEDWDSQALANCIWAFARLNIRPPKSFLDLWYNAFLKSIQNVNSQELGLCMWAWGKLRGEVSRAFLMTCSKRLQEQCEINKLDSQTISNALWCFARLEYIPDQSTVIALQNAFIVHEHKLMKRRNGALKLQSNPKFAQETSNILWSLTKLTILSSSLSQQQNSVGSNQQFVISNEFYRAMERRLWTISSTLDAHSLSILLWSSSKLISWKIPVYILTAFYHRFLCIYQTCNAQSLAILISSFARLQIIPENDSDFWKHWYASFDRHSATFNCTGLVSTIWSFGTMRKEPDASFLNSWYGCFSRHIQSMNGQHLSNSIWALARAQVEIRDVFYEDWFNAFDREMLSTNSHELALILWAFGKLKYKPDVRFLDKWYFGFELRLASFTNRGLVMILWGFASMNSIPAHQFLEQWTACFHIHRNSFSASDLSIVLWSCAALKLKSHPEFLNECIQSLINVCQSRSSKEIALLKGQEISNILWAFAKLELIPNASLYTTINDYFLNDSVHFNGQELSIVFWSLSKFELKPSESFLNTWYFRFEQEYESMDYLALTNSLEAFSKLKIQPTDHFLKLWLSAFKRELPHAPKDFLTLYNTWAVEKFGALVRSNRQVQ